jgi:hypothetical protein
MYYERQTTLVVASIPHSTPPDWSGVADHARWQLLTGAA